MTQFRYNRNEKWFKGNTHIHSTCSDGGKTFTELAALYAGAGYDFLFRTDHRVSSDVATDTADFPLLWMDGIELDGKDKQQSYYHVVCLGKVPEEIEKMDFPDALQLARAHNAVTILAHPNWSGNSPAEALRWHFDGVEVYNHVCHWLNGKSNGSVYWNLMLSEQPNTFGLAVDDAHISTAHPGWNGGWILINAPELTRKNVMSAIRAGHFYSSTGPEFQSITCRGTTVEVQTSPVQFIRLVGEKWNGQRAGTFDSAPLTSATFQLNPEWAYAYLEIEDSNGRLAWTNSLIINE